MIDAYAILPKSYYKYGVSGSYSVIIGMYSAAPIKTDDSSRILFWHGAKLFEILDLNENWEASCFPVLCVLCFWNISIVSLVSVHFGMKRTILIILLMNSGRNFSSNW